MITNQTDKAKCLESRGPDSPFTLGNFWIILIGFSLGYGLLFSLAPFIYDTLMYFCPELTEKLRLNVFRVATALRFAVFPFYLFVIVAIVWKSKQRPFHGMSVPIIVLLAVLYLRFIADSFYFADDGIRNYAKYSWLFIPLSLYLPILFFSVPLSEKGKKYAFYVILGTFIFTSLVRLVGIFPYMIGGETSKTLLFQRENPLYDSIRLSYGTYLAFLSLWCLFAGKGGKYRYPVFLFLYCLGASLTYFQCLRSLFAASVMAHFLLFAFYFFSKDKRNWFVVLISILLVNVFYAGMIGYNDRKRTMLGRYARTFTFLRSDVARSIEASKQKKEEAQRKAEEEAGLGSVNAENQTEVNGYWMDEYWTDEYWAMDPDLDEPKPEESPLSDIIPAPLEVVLHEEVSNEEFKEFIAGKKYARTALEGRGVIWKEAVKRIKESPILGSHKRIHGWTAHNTILDVTLGTGIFGGLLFLGILFYGIRDTIFVFRKMPDFGWVGAIYLIESLNICISGQTIESVTLWWFSLLVLRANVYVYERSRRTAGVKDAPHTTETASAPLTVHSS